MPRMIDQFMWSYQESFRITLQFRANRVLKRLGARHEVKVLLVGALRPGRQNHNAVCVEPEKGEWPVELFHDLLQKIEAECSAHHLNDIIYGDAPSMRDKPENMRRDATRLAVAALLAPYDTAQYVVSFCGIARPIDDYYVVPVIQVPGDLFRKFVPLRPRPTITPYEWQGPRSLIHATMRALLDEAEKELERPDPGRFMTDLASDGSEIVLAAARNFVHSPGLAIDRRYLPSALFDWCNSISTQMYEGAQGRGQILLANPKNPAIEFLAIFKHPVPLNDPRWSRKALQFSSPEACLVGDTTAIHGIGRLREIFDPESEEVFAIRFLDRFHWELACGERVLMRSHYGAPLLPQEQIEQSEFTTTFHRLFPTGDATLAWALFQAGITADHGNMLVFTEDAALEAERLSREGTTIEPVTLTPTLYQQFSRIDGTVLVDPKGVCHAVGVILDGAASTYCVRSRGSRYNSAVRYVRAGRKRFAIVVSDDQTVDVLPEIRPLMSRSEIEHQIETLESATTDNYRAAQRWLDDHRFYLDKAQCERIRVALQRIDEIALDMGEIRFVLSEFTPDPDMDESYLLP